MQLKYFKTKKLNQKKYSQSGTRSYTIQLTASGKKIVSETDNFANPITEIITKSNEADKLILWENIQT